MITESWSRDQLMKEKGLVPGNVPPVGSLASSHDSQSEGGSATKFVARDAFQNGVWKPITDFGTDAKWKDYVENSKTNPQQYHM